MSILQEYEEIKRSIGEEKWTSIDAYIKQNPSLTFDKLIYNQQNYKMFEKWFYETIKLQKIEILNTWGNDYGDICCNAKLYKNDKPVANVIIGYDETTIRYQYGDKDSKLTDEFVKESIESLINMDFQTYIVLPKISKCSKLLIEIYDNVCSNESSMCHIDYEDWKLQYEDDYSEEDIDELQKEIIKYNLSNVICLDEGEYKIIGYEDLQTCFNDDRNLNNDKGMEF